MGQIDRLANGEIYLRLTSDSFELPKYGIDLIKYAGSAITHVNGNKIL